MSSELDYVTRKPCDCAPTRPCYRNGWREAESRPNWPLGALGILCKTEAQGAQDQRAVSKQSPKILPFGKTPTTTEFKFWLVIEAPGEALVSPPLMRRFGTFSEATEKAEELTRQYGRSHYILEAIRLVRPVDAPPVTVDLTDPVPF